MTLTRNEWAFELSGSLISSLNPHPAWWTTRDCEQENSQRLGWYNMVRTPMYYTQHIYTPDKRIYALWIWSPAVFFERISGWIVYGTQSRSVAVWLAYFSRRRTDSAIHKCLCLINLFKWYPASSSHYNYQSAFGWADLR